MKIYFHLNVKNTANNINLMSFKGNFDSIVPNSDEASFVRLHVGQTAIGERISEVCIGQNFFTKFPMPNLSLIHI